MLMEKTKYFFVFPTLAKCHYATTSFNLLMSKGAYNIFALVINFLKND
jgi:hypothetical protein